MTDNKDELWTVKEVAEYLQFDERIIYKMIEKGKIPVCKVDGQWRFKKELIKRWLEEPYLDENKG